MKYHENGFTAVELLLALIAVTLISFTGYFVYHTQSQAATTYNASTADASSNTAKAKKSAQAKTQTPAQSQSYLDIKEWGVKMPLKGASSDAYYVLITGTDGGTYAYLSTKSAPTGFEAAPPDKLGLGAITRFTKDTPNPMGGPAPLVAALPDAIKIGTHYYAFDGPNGGGELNDADGVKIGQIKVALHDAFKGLQAD